MVNDYEELGKIVYKFIDRMTDYDTPEEAEKILNEFVNGCFPIINERIDQLWKEKYGYTCSAFLNMKRGKPIDMLREKYKS